MQSSFYPAYCSQINHLHFLSTVAQICRLFFADVDLGVTAQGLKKVMFVTITFRDASPLQVLRPNTK